MKPLPWPDFTEMTDPMTQLVALSRYYGSDPDFVLAGGGNTSIKSDGRLHVKASGTALADVDESHFVEMDGQALERILSVEPDPDAVQREEDFKQAVMAARIHPERGQRPSVECVLHQTLPARFVVHTHATVANQITCSQGGKALAEALLGDDLMWADYVDPGFVLAKKLAEALGKYQKETGRDYPPVVLMENHGLIVSGDTPEAIREWTDRALEKIHAHLETTDREAPFGPLKEPASLTRAVVNRYGPILRALLRDQSEPKVVVFDDRPEILNLVCGEGGKEAALGGPMIPDQIVYCKSAPLWVKPDFAEDAAATIERLRRAVTDYEQRHQYKPIIVLVEGVGLFAAGDHWPGADTARLVYLDAIKIMAGAKRLGGIQPMKARDSRFIEQWEVEAYRRKVAAGAAQAKRMAGKVAVVTGAARGFGLEIAQNLIAEGAHVVLTDINDQDAAREADGLSLKYGNGRALSLPINVADNESVAETFHWVVRHYGGFDLLVANAGVVRAASVKEQLPDDFRFVTDVNYIGYFNCVQHAAPIMALTHRTDPALMTDIIQINSKSGLVGSNRNAAYAGSKFGGIGLTQSFALELVEDGIKVNSICPGNFFDGPLWSDPKNGLFVQYLESGKVPGAKTVAEVRRAYEARIPMGRGCTTPDVMKAIYYLVEQQYETGQALPVTGGQVMLS